MIKVALVGYGKMGRVVDEIAAARGVEVVDRFTRGRPLRADDAHRFKLDSPSGTALEIQRRMARSYGEREVPMPDVNGVWVIEKL